MAAEESLQPERNEVNEDWGKESGALGMKLLHAGTYSEAAASETTVTVCLAVIK